MPFSNGTPSVAGSWTSSSGNTANSWTNQVQLEVFDRLIDINGNYIVDVDGNYISLGGGIVTGDADDDGSWTNPGGISTVWNVGA